MNQAEFVAELTARFGSDPMNWAFICPACREVATGQDFRTAIAERKLEGKMASDFLGQVCIGRVLGALEAKSRKDWTGRGCDWAAYGLFAGPNFITNHEGKQIACFEMAPANYKEMLTNGINFKSGISHEA